MHAATPPDDRAEPDAYAAADDALVGPHSPAPGTLEGRLLVSRGERCALQQIDLRRMRVDRSGSAIGCEFWVSPDGDLALTQSIVARSEDGSQHSLLSLAGNVGPVEQQPSSVRNPTRWQGSPAWAPRNDRIAICNDEDETLVVDLDTDQERRLVGCWPVFTPSGSVLTLHDPTLGNRSSDVLSVPNPSLEVSRPLLSIVEQLILEEGETRLDLATVREELPGASSTSSSRILGFAPYGGGRLAVTVIYLEGLELRSVVQFWEGGDLARSVEIPVVLGRDVEIDLDGERFGAPVHSLRFGPENRELAVTVHGHVDELVVIDPRSGRLILGPIQNAAFDWSPQGRWLGVATSAGQIDIYGPDRSRAPTFRLPIATSALAWRTD